jgi:hypothetical protein
MSKRKASTELSSAYTKKPNTSKDYVYHNAVNRYNNKPQIQKVTPTKIGERPIYKFFIDFDGKYFPL